MSQGARSVSTKMTMAMARLAWLRCQPAGQVLQEDTSFYNTVF